MTSGRATESRSEPPWNDDVVPREALAQSRRRYYSRARQIKAERTREALLDAAVQLIVETGDFRPEASAIAARAKVHPATINRHFSAAHLLYRVVARERTGAVLEALGLVAMDDARNAALQTDLVWIAMTGRRRDDWA